LAAAVARSPLSAAEKFDYRKECYKMKITDFVNSKDIREYLEEINYKPTAPEAAWLVWQSKNHTVKEKHDFWRHILDTTEDCAIPSAKFAIEQPPLHEFLRRYMEIEDNLISAFYKEGEDAVYSYRMYFGDGECRQWYNVSAVFRSFDEAYSHSQDDGEPPYADFIEFVKTYVGKEEKTIIVRFNPQKEIVLVDEMNCFDEKDSEIVSFGFQEMSLSFPLPFKKGEILKRVRGLYNRPSYHYTTYVFDSVVNEHDYTVIKGYIVDENGGVHYEGVHFYMEMERVSLPLEDENKILRPISKYLSGEIDLVLLLGAYRHILSSNEADMVDQYLLCTKEERKLAGIEDET
jgi:hypothetical protein